MIEHERNWKPGLSFRWLALCTVIALGGWTVPEVEAQQIFRWTDENGKVHYGNQPPAGAKAPEARGRVKSEAEVQCEMAAKDACKRFLDDFGDYFNSEAYRECVAANKRPCARFRAEVKPTPAPARFVSTPTLHVEPANGDSLRCEMRCLEKCRGQVEIRTDRVLKKGENIGAERYEMTVRPDTAGQAFCTASTASTDVQLVLSVLRDGLVTASVEGQ